jgi:hypothetical protein
MDVLFAIVFGGVLVYWLVSTVIDGIKNPDEKGDTWRRGP